MEKKWEYNETVHHLFIDFKKVYVSVRMEVLYNILIEFGIPKKLVRLLKMCLTLRVGKNLSDMFTTRNGLKQGDALSPLLFNFVLDSVSQSPGRGTVSGPGINFTGPREA